MKHKKEVRRGRHPAGPSRDSEGNVPLKVESIFGKESRMAWVHFTLGVEGAQLSTGEARMIASWLLEAAEAAEHDAVLVTSLREVEVPEDMIRALLLKMRIEREKRWGTHVSAA